LLQAFTSASELFLDMETPGCLDIYWMFVPDWHHTTSIVKDDLEERTSKESEYYDISWNPYKVQLTIQ
jgi:hypothetical protein